MYLYTKCSPRGLEVTDVSCRINKDMQNAWKCLAKCREIPDRMHAQAFRPASRYVPMMCLIMTEWQIIAENAHCVLPAHLHVSMILHKKIWFLRVISLHYHTSCKNKSITKCALKPYWAYYIIFYGIQSTVIYFKCCFSA